MITTGALFDAINLTLVAKYPARTVYINNCPKEFDRPSFLLEAVRVSASDAGRNVVSVDAYYTITIFEAIDDYYNSDAVALLETQDAVIGLFRAGHLTVSGRAVKLKSSAGGMDTDRAYVDLQFAYFDDRAEPAAPGPLMAEMETTIKQEG